MKYIILLLAILFSVDVVAQSDLNFCGSNHGRSPWLKSFQARPAHAKSQFRNDDIILVPLSIHLISKDNGKAAFSDNSLIKNLCNLNDVFLSSNIQFYIFGDIHVTASSAMYEHNTSNAGGEFMLAHNIPNTLNCYVVGDPASNCGYNLPWAGIAIAKSCMKTTDLTWAHEIGHALSLPHPFLGWEGGQSYDGTVPANFNTPAPEYVTYNYTDFKDVQHMDTLIIDTAYVELVDGSNCHIAADGFCDTKPDYIAGRWSCNNDGLSNATQLDPNGVSFQSNGNVLMGYSSATNKSTNKCPGIFTEEQIQAMRANLLEEKSDYLDQEFYDFDGISEDIVDNYPTEGEKVSYQEADFTWDLAEGDADRYIVQIGIENTMSLILLDTIVSEQALTLYTLDNNKTFYWRVRAIDNNEFCSEFDDIHEFETADLSAVFSLNDDICSIYPTRLNDGDDIHVTFPYKQNYSYTIVDRSGKIIVSQQSVLSNTIKISTIPVGLYFLNITNVEGSESFKIVVQ